MGLAGSPSRICDLMAAILAGKEILSSNSLNDLAERVSTFLLPLFRAQGCYFGELRDGSFDLWNPIVCTGACAGNHKLYSERYFKIDPLVSAPYSPYPNTVYVTDDIIQDKDAFQRGEFYNEFLKPLSISTHLFLNLRNSGRLVGTLIVTRDRRSARFGSIEKRLAMILEPYLSTALDMALRMDQTLQERLILNLLCEEMSPRAVMVLDGSLRPMFVNRRSDFILSTLYQPGESRKELPLSLRAMLQAGTSENSKTQTGSLSSPAMRTFEIVGRGTIPRVRVSVRSTGALNTSHSLVFIELEDNGFSSSTGLDPCYLTDRELEIVSCICEGMRNGQIAKKLFISSHTVINHVSHIYRKLGINSRTALCRLVLGRTSPSVADNGKPAESSHPGKPFLCVDPGPVHPSRRTRVSES